MPDATDWILLAFLFALGACLGSFLNVVVFRLPGIDAPPVTGPRSFVAATRLKLRGLSYPPSHCPRCGYALRWYDNFPILGWVWLGGKCRKCRLPISAQYPLIELLTALLFTSFYVAFFLAGPQWGPPTPAVETPLAVPTVPGGRLGPMNEVPPDAIDPASLPPGYALSAARQDRVLPAGTIVRTPDLPATGGGDRYEPLAATPKPSGGISLLTAVLRQTATVGRDWPALAIVLTLAWCLLAASLIDARLFHIPAGLSYLPAVVGLGLHAVYDQPLAPLSLMVGRVGCAWAVGGGLGWGLSLALRYFGALRPSFADEAPLLEIDRDNAGQPEPTDAEWAQIKRTTRREMRWELAFLAPPVLLGVACAASAAYTNFGLWDALVSNRFASALLGSLLGGLVGAGVIWIVRVLGSLAFGREAMGLGDADLMFGVGCCLGAGPAGLALFPAALVGLVFAVYRLVVRSRHELPFGPYLAVASVGLIFFWNGLTDHLAPSVDGLSFLLGHAAALFGL